MPKTSPGAATAYVNGRIYTVDSKTPWAEACLVASGRFQVVGSTKDVLAAAGSAHVVDLGGRMVMPGIHDAHTHLLLSGLKHRVEARLAPEAQSEESVVRTLRSFCQCCDRSVLGLGRWIVGGDINPNLFPEGLDRKFLDEAFPDEPVYLLDYTQHHAMVNSKALELAGISASTPDPKGGKFVRRPGTNEPTGELVERATWPARLAVPGYAPHVCRQVLQWAMETSSAFGITSVQEASASRLQLEALKAIDEEGGLPMRIAAHLVWQEPRFGLGTPEELDRLIEERTAFESARVNPNFIKLWMDGAPLPPHPTHAAVDPATNEIDFTNIMFEPQEVLQAFLRFDKAGLTIKCHCAGDGAARLALDTFEQVRRINGANGPVHEVAHAGFIHPDDLPRFARHNVIAEMSPALWHRKEPEFKVLDYGFKFATLRQHGARVTIGSDWIITPDPNLFPALQGVLERGAESLDLETALRCMTLDGVAAVGKDSVSGSISAGKSADFIVLDRNLFEIPTSEVGATKVLRTVFEGRAVFERN